MPASCSARADGDQIGRLADDLEGFAEIGDLLGTGVEHGHQDVVLGLAVLLERDDTLASEQVGDRTRVGHVAAVAGHRGANLTGRTVAVVGEALDQHGDTVGSVALVHDGLPVGAARFFTGAALAGALDVVVGDRRLLRLLDGVVQGGVARQDRRRRYGPPPRCS